MYRYLYEQISSRAGDIFGFMPFPWRLFSSYRKTMKTLRRQAFQSAKVLRRYQLRNLKQLLCYAYQHVPYYNLSFKRLSFHPSQFSSFEQIEHLPLLSRQDVFSNFAQLCSTRFNNLLAYTGRTGGTTGQPLSLYLSLTSYFKEWAFIHDLWRRVGFQPGDRRVAFLGVPFTKNIPCKLKYCKLHRELQISPRHLSPDDMQGYIGLINEFQPAFLYGLPSALTVFASYMLDTGQTLHNLRGILCGSENLRPSQISSLTHAFAAPVYSWYGQTEKVVLAGWCEVSNDYHIIPEYGYAELVDSEGHVITTPGVLGEIVGTGFINLAMPLIRYRTGDFAAYSDGECSCGRSHLRFKHVHGRRNDDYFVTKDKQKVLFSSLDGQKSVFDIVSQWQFAQIRPGKVEVRILTNSKTSPNQLKQLRLELNSQFQNGIDFDVKLVNHFERTDRGKVKTLLQKLP